MGRKKLTEVEKIRALTIIDLGVPITKVAEELVSRQAIHKLMKVA